MRFQNVYECPNLDFESTYESLCHVLPSVDKTRKGSISFRISNKKIAVLIFPKGKVQVAWENEKEKQKLFPYLESLIKTDNGQKTELKPLHGNLVKFPYPPPEHFVWAWCKEKFAFFQKLGFFNWVERRAERKRQEREREYAEIDREIRTCQYRRACNHAESLLREDDPEYLIKCDKIKLEKRTEYHLDA